MKNDYKCGRGLPLNFIMCRSIWECGGVWAVGSPMLGLWESALVLGKGPKEGEAPLCLWVFPGLGVICSQPDGGASLSRGYSQGPKGRGSEGELQGWALAAMMPGYGMGDYLYWLTVSAVGFAVAPCWSHSTQDSPGLHWTSLLLNWFKFAWLTVWCSFHLRLWAQPFQQISVCVVFIQSWTEDSTSIVVCKELDVLETSCLCKSWLWGLLWKIPLNAVKKQNPAE